MALHALAGVVLAAVLAGTVAKAQDRYPSEPVRIVVSFSAGGPTDTVARVMGARMGELLGQQFLVENKAGAGGNIGADLVAKASPDGYTLLMATVRPTPSIRDCTSGCRMIRFAISRRSDKWG